MLKTEDISVDDLTFTTQQFPAMRSFALLTRLVKALGPAIAVLGSAGADAQVEDMMPTLGPALAVLDPAEAQALVLAVLEGTYVILPDTTGGKRVELRSQANVDIVFSGRLPMMFKVIAHAVKVNYRDFFNGSVPAAPRIPTPSGA